MTASERNELLKKYTTMKTQAADLEGQLSLMREKILHEVKPGVYDDMLVCIEDQERESFQWKQAQAKLSEPILSKLQEFVKKSEFQTLKVVKIGGEK